MKNTKQFLFAIAALCGLVSAFATDVKKYSGTTYYAVTDGRGACGFYWTTTKPSSINFFCGSCTRGYCTIVTNGTWDPLTHPDITPTSLQATTPYPTTCIFQLK